MSGGRRRLSPLDLVFLYGETPATTMHVAGLHIYEAPEGDPQQFFRDFDDEVRGATKVEPPFNLRLAHPRLRLSPLQSWVPADDVDLEYHIRRSALPSPGGERELGALVSRLHSNPIDFSRPPWEVHLIEGLQGGRFAVYFKVHHALVDGYSATQILVRSHARDAAERRPLFFQMPRVKRPPRERTDGDSPTDEGGLAGGLGRRVKTSVAFGRAMYNAQIRRDGEYKDLVGSVQAPKSILNQRISRNRRFATQQYDLAVLKEIGTKCNATLNDVMLSVIGGGLRSFLRELGELPDKPLIAFVPVNIRPKGDVGGGNAVSAILASLGTDIDDPLERLEAVAASTRIAKAQFEGLSQDAIMAFGAALLSPLTLQSASAFAGIKTPLPLNCNVIVSNVPGPSYPLYLRGARLLADYPVSIPLHGVALNITLFSYVDTMCVGFIGCRDTVPRLQRLAVQTGHALEELRRAAG